MPDNYSNNRFNFDINTARGTLRKSHPKSKFCIRRLEDDKSVFSNYSPTITYMGEEIVVLQIMLLNDAEGLIEYVPKRYWEEK